MQTCAGQESGPVFNRYKPFVTNTLYTLTTARVLPWAWVARLCQTRNSTQALALAERRRGTEVGEEPITDGAIVAADVYSVRTQIAKWESLTHDRPATTSGKSVIGSFGCLTPNPWNPCNPWQMMFTPAPEKGRELTVTSGAGPGTLLLVDVDCVPSPIDVDPITGRLRELLDGCINLLPVLMNALRIPRHGRHFLAGNPNALGAPSRQTPTPSFTGAHAIDLPHPAAETATTTVRPRSRFLICDPLRLK